MGYQQVFTGAPNDHVINKRDLKFYFAYHSFAGIIFALLWVEDAGICVGGRPKYIEGSRVEVTEEEFLSGTTALEMKYPVPLDMTGLVYKRPSSG